MSCSEIITEIARMEADNRRLNDEVQYLSRTCIRADKFYNVAMTTGDVANLHSVTPALVRKYVTLGLIPVHPMSTSAKILVRASDALVIDFKELKRQAKYKVR